MKLGKTYFSGSLTFDEGNNVIGPSSASFDNVVVGGTITAREFRTETITAFQLSQSGSTKFGDSADDTHQFTGSLNVNGAVLSNNKFALGTSNDGTTGQFATDNSNNYLDYLGDLIIRTSAASSEKMRIDSNGNVGIGTNSPAAKFHVQTGTSDEVTDFTVGSFGTVTISRNHALTPSIETNFGSGRAILRLNSGGNLLTNISTDVSYFNGGSVGIGTTSPSRQLEIYGTNDGYLKVDGGRVDNHGYTLGSDAYGFIIYDDTSASYRFTIDQDTGNIGIGNPNPLGKLQITTGDSGASSAWSNADELILESSGNAGLAFQTPNTGAATIAFQDPESVQAGFIQYLHSDNLMRFATNGNNIRAVIDSDGNVGIGTDSPTAKLHVNGGQILNGDLTIPYSSAAVTNTIGVQTSPTNPFSQTAKTLVIQGANAYQAGSPTQAQAGGDVYLKGGYGVVNPGLGVYAGDVYIQGGTTNTGGTSGAGTIYLDTAGSTRMFINSEGSVGIGTTSPNATLHANGGVHFGPDSGVLNPSTGQVLIETASGGTPTLQFYPYGSSVMFLKSDGTTGVLGWNSGADREININNEGAGNILVGIGTGAPAETLHVNKNAASNIVGGYFTNSQANTGAESVSLAFGLNRSGGDFVRQVKAITFAAEQQWTGTPSTVDGYLSFSTIQDENVKERMRISSGGIVYIMGATASVNNSLQFQYNSTAGSAEIYSKSTAGNTHFEFYASDSGTTNEVMRITKEGRITSATDNKALTAIHPRSIAISHGGSTSWTYDLDPVALFGTRVSGGHLHIRASGWQSRLNAGYIVYRNDGGGSSVIGTGNVTYYQTVHSDNGGTDAAIAVSLPSSSTNVIRISFSGWHSNNHGFECVVTTTN